MSEFFDDRIEYDLTPLTRKDLPLFILAHPHPLYEGSMYNKVIDQMFRRSKDLGWGALRFNFRGVGRSKGPHDGGIGEIDDFLTLSEWIQNTYHPERLIFLGYSFGAWIAFEAAKRFKSALSSVVLIAPPVTMYPHDPASHRDNTQTIVFAAEKDELIPLASTQEWFAKLPSLKHLEIISNADHYFIGTTTELIIKCQAYFLKTPNLEYP